MNERPRVGIIVPAFNAARYLAQTLAGVLAQTVADWHCVVVDDGSNDATVEIARQYADRDARFRVLVQPQNGGVSKARSDGLAALPATPFLIFLDADDVWLPHALQRLIEALEAPANAAAPAAHAIASFIDGQGDPIPPDVHAARLKRLEFFDGAIVEPSSAELTSSMMLATWPCVLTPGIVLIRRDAFDAAGGWDASLSIGEDWELWYRLSLRSPLAFVPEPLIRFRVHANSSSRTWKRALRLADARRKVMNEPTGTAADHRYARQAYRAMSRRLGLERIAQGFTSLAKLDAKGALRGLAGGAVNLAIGLKPF